MTVRTAPEEQKVAIEVRGREKERRSRTTAARPDIQGLRALAVVLVILDHLGAWPRGGFIGVDIFFVISGFLITGLLLREQQGKNRSSILWFYRRRIKRILPAAALVLAVTVVASRFISFYAQAQRTSTDSLWSAIFWANWHFRSAGTDYFQQGQTPSPLQHYWSLSVEEQFYVVWPIMMIVVGAIGVRLLHGKRLPAITVMIAALTAAAFAWSMHESGNAPTAAYFSTFSRAWELGAGALLACLVGYIPKLSRTVRCLVSLTGLGVIFLGAAFINNTSRFPAPWALAPVFGAILVIAAGVGATGFDFNPALNNPVSNYLGDLSYSLYLWHFPIIILLGSLIRPNGAGCYVLAAGLILSASVLSYHLVENPVRNSSWLDGSSVRAWNPRQRRIDVSAEAVGALITALVLAAALITVSQDPPVPAAGTVPLLPARPAASGVVAALPSAVTAANLKVALGATTWPALDLSADALMKLLPVALSDPDCFNGYPNIDKRCAFGASKSPHAAVILGDSIAMTYEPTINAALPSWRIFTFGKASCPWADALVSTQTENAYTSCLDFHKRVYAEILALHPSAIFLSGSENSIASLTSNAKDAAAQAEWASAEKITLTALSAAHAPMYVLSPTPVGTDVARCASRLNGPRDCNLQGPSSNWLAEQSATSAAVAGMTDVSVIDTTPWVCVGGECPALYLGEPIRTDGQHLTQQFATNLAANFLTAVRATDPRLFAGR